MRKTKTPLKSLLLFTIFAAIVIPGLLQRQTVNGEEKTLLNIASQGVEYKATYSEPSPWPLSPRQGRCKALELRGDDPVDDQLIESIQKLKRLERLEFKGGTLSDLLLQKLKEELPSIKEIFHQVKGEGRQLAN